MASTVDEQRKERQMDEVEVLKAVYIDAFSDLRKVDVWKVYRPPEVSLHLIPLQSMHGDAEVHAYVDLIVKCSARYPDEVPTLKLENAKGLSNDNLATLKNELIALAGNKVGEVMIYDLAQYVQNFLEPFNKPGPKSFYEEMVSRQRKQAEQQAQQEQQKIDLQKRLEEKENELIEEQIQRRQEELREDTRRRREARRENVASDALDNSPNSQINQASNIRESELKTRNLTKSPRRNRKDSMNLCERRSSTPVRDSGDANIDHRRGSIVSFDKNERQIRRATILGNSSRGYTVYLGLDVASGELVTLTEWTLKWRHVNKSTSESSAKEYVEKEQQKYIKQINNIDHELQSLIKLNHPGLVKYLSMTHFVEQSAVVIYVLKEYVNGCRVDMHVENGVPLPYDLLRYYTKYLLDVLGYLHDKAVTHKDLRASCVLLDNEGTVRLADYSLDKRLSGLYESVESAQSGVQFAATDDDRPQPLGRSAKKADVYQMGLLVLSLAVGGKLTDLLPDVPSTLPPDLHDFIKKCLIKDEKLRWSTNQLLDHEFVKSNFRSDLKVNLKRPEPSSVPTRRLNDPDHLDDFCYIASDTQGQSRLTREFEILEFLGKGGFGDVLKVRNKLDGRCYAMKRILLNPKSKQFNKKITREVKLLSRLNHENVVRYYYSWIETSIDPLSEETDTSSGQPTDVSKLSHSKSDRLSSLVNEEIPVVGLSEPSVEWSISEDVPQFPRDSSSSESESESEDDEDNVFGPSFSAMFEAEESFSVVFEQNDENSTSEDKDNQNSCEPSRRDENQPEFQVPRAQFLYIQMEFCEKSTLKHCIEAGLYDDRSRVWRLFREIVEGLDHIHEQGMIHRDLKPFNIFLDSNDHVKIGDFGLATTSIVAANKLVRHQQHQHQVHADTSLLSQETSRSGDLGDDLTGKVGTSLYVAPEIMDLSTLRGNYTQKVDIYSLGLIFFEMCYHPLVTGMERVKILTNLRKPCIQLPDDFDLLEMHNQTEIIRWLLEHDPNKRPSSKELLQSQYLPPPLMEEAELSEMLRSTISNPQSKAYKRMVSAMFSQPVSAAADYTYDIDFYRGYYNMNQGLQIDFVHQLIVHIFEKHGAVQLKSQLLMPKNSLYEHCDQYSCYMDRSGGMVSLPYDLRVPFARFIARNNVTSLKRYCIQNVFREKKIHGIHPGQLTEAAFDIVTQTAGSLIPDAELFHVVQDIIDLFPSLQKRNYYIRLNHLSLLKGILLYCGIQDDLHLHVIRIMNDTKAVVRKETERYNRLSDLGLSDSCINTMIGFMNLEGPFDKIVQKLICIKKTKGLAGSLVKKGLHELETIMCHAESMGCKFQWVLMFLPVANVSLYCGLMFQVMSKIQKKNDKFVVDILAVGGRYDSLVAKFRRRTLHGTPQSAVGLSISVDKIIASLDENFLVRHAMPSLADVIICTVGHKILIKEQLALARKLWDAGVRAMINYDPSQSLEELQELCFRQRIRHLAVLKDQDSGYVRVQVIEKDRPTEKKVSVTEAVDFFQKRLSSELSETALNLKSSSGFNLLSINNDTQTSQSHTSYQSSQFITTFIQGDNKLSGGSRRKYEAQMYPKIINVLKVLSPKLHLEVLAFDLPGDKDCLLKNISLILDLENDEKCYQSSVSMILEKYQRYRRYLAKVFELIHSLRFRVAKEGKCPPILLYALKDDCHQLLLCYS